MRRVLGHAPGRLKGAASLGIEEDRSHVAEMARVHVADAQQRRMFQRLAVQQKLGI